MGGARPFFVEGHRPAARPAGHDLPAPPGDPGPARRGRRGAVGGQGDRPAPGDHLRHGLHARAPVHRVRMDPRHAPRGPGAGRAAAPGPGRRHDRRRGGRARGRAPGRPAAPAADPALRALGSRPRAEDHRPGHRRSALRTGNTGRGRRRPPTARPWAGCCTRCSPATGPATRPPRCRPRPGTRGASARRARSAPGYPPCSTPSPTAPCGGRPPTPRCGRRLRPGSPWRFARCSGRPTSWKGRKTRRRRRRAPGPAGCRPGGMRGTPGPGWAPHHAAAPAGITTGGVTTGAAAPRPGPGRRSGRWSGSCRRPAPA